MMTRILLSLISLTLMASGLDQNENQQSDIWEVNYGAIHLLATADADHDGFSNALESAAGTDPLDPLSRPFLELLPAEAGAVNAEWPSQRGKVYDIQSSPDLSPLSWITLGTVTGDGDSLLQTLTTTSQNQGFFRLMARDVDSDSDGLSDWEEWKIGFNPSNAQSNRLGNDGTNTATTDLQQFTASWNDASTVSVGLVDGDVREDWPDKGVIAIRRSGGVQPITVNVSITGTATRAGDYTTISANQVFIPLGVRETWLEITPIHDASNEGMETVIVTATAGTGYSLGTTDSALVTIHDASAVPSAKAAARFLIQAAFGPDQDSTSDEDMYPENIEEVMAFGSFAAWIDDQFSKPIGYIQPWVDWAVVGNTANNMGLYGNYKEFSWWGRAMGSPKLRPDNEVTQLPDPLRQRVAFALSEILVAGDRPEALAVEPQGMANFYDLMVKHAFGNFHDLLYDVATHPVMGVYLSHLNNQKANPALNTYPDENFAREIMQLFSIGLWKLNVDGSRQLNAQNQPIPTYNNTDITELARVFTGMTFADKPFPGTNGDYKLPMKMFDAHHDCNAKVLLGGFVIPARTPSAGNTGTAGLADVSDAVNNLFNQASVGPFICKQLIQRLVTSNPSADYIGRVAALFNNNGSSVRGDMKAVVAAILLDPEARDPAMMDVPTWGKLREPFLRVVNFARAFNAASSSGHYALDQFVIDHLQDPMNSPSVFNFFLPSHSPPGPITQLGLVAPEFQIINASTAVTGANYFWQAIGSNDLHTNGTTAEYAVRLQTDTELGMITPSAQINEDVPTGPAMDPDPLIRRLDLALTGGTLSPRQFQIIREAMLRIGTGTWKWHRERLRLAIYMITTSADYNVLR